MYQINTGINGVGYYGFTPLTWGGWAQPIHGIYPHQYYSFGGSQFKISPVSTTPHMSGPLSSGPAVPFRNIHYFSKI